MKRIFAIMLLIFLAVTIYADGKPRVMVLNATIKRNFYDTYKIGDGEEYITIELRKAILDSGAFDVINNDKVLEEAVASQYNGAYDIDTVAKYGEKLGANYAIIPKVLLNKVDPVNKKNYSQGVIIRFECNAELYNLSTGELLFSCSSKGSKKDSVSSLKVENEHKYGNPKIHGILAGTSKEASGLLEEIAYDLANKLKCSFGGEIISKLKLTDNELKADSYVEMEKFYINDIPKGKRCKILYYDSENYPVVCGECMVDTVQKNKVRMYVTRLLGKIPSKTDFYAEVCMKGLMNPEDEDDVFPIVPLKNRLSAIILPVCDKEIGKTIVNSIICDNFVKRNFDITDEATRNRLMENVLEQSQLKDDPEGYLRALENVTDVDLAVIPELNWSVIKKDTYKATCTLGLKIIDMRSLETIFSKSDSQIAPGITEEDALNNSYRLLINDMFDDNDIVGLVEKLDTRENYISLVINNMDTVTLSNEVQKKIFDGSNIGKIERVSFEKRVVTYKVYSLKDYDKFIEHLESLKIGTKHLEVRKTDSKQLILDLCE